MIFFFKKYWTFIILGLLVLFLYTVNLNKNSRFIWDESRAMVDMHRIWEKKLITFVGPISEDNLEMFPSLSYYMYLPATILTRFDPLGPAYMAVLYGLVAWLIVAITLIKKLGNTPKVFLLSLLVAILNPVLVASRWAWNPNLVIFWLTIYFVSLVYQNPLLLFIGGVSLGASLYHHYLAAFGVIPLLLLLPILYQGKKNNLRKVMLTLLGFLSSMVPFVLFELKNHFFINSHSFLSANGKSFLSFSSLSYLENLWHALLIFSNFFVLDNLFISVSFLLSLLIIFVSYHRDKVICYLFLSLFISLLFFGFVKSVYPHYLYAEISIIMFLLLRFFFLNKNTFGKLILVVLLFFSFQKAINLVKNYIWEGDIMAVRNVTEHILTEREPATNVAVLVSQDVNTTGQRFRDMVLINGKTLYPKDAYSTSQVLFVISETQSMSLVMKDPAWEISSFKNSTITNVWQVSDYPMYLYRLEKSK